jgi:transcriptional regulator of arginine metabolism
VRHPTGIRWAQNLVIIKTLPGLASAACSTLDGMDIPSLVGSLAGDDTAFLAMRDNESAEHFCRDIKAML